MSAESIAHALIRECFDRENPPLFLIGVSGGRDSVVLLHLMSRLSLPEGLLRAVHVHHGLRAEADGDAAFVAALGSELGIPTRSVHRDARAVAARDGLGIEAAARTVRYAAFDAELRALGFAPFTDDPDPIRTLHQGPYHTTAGRSAYLVLAHHAADNAETLLLHIGRGTGLDGLGGMTPRRGAVLRPLLGWGAEDLGAYVERYDLTYRTDASNRDPAYLRNRIRHELVPLWSDLVGYDVRDGLLRMQAHLARDRAYLDAQSRAAFREVRIGTVAAAAATVTFSPQSGEGAAVIAADRYRALDPALRMRVLGHMDPWGGRDLAEVHRSAMDACLTEGRSGTLDLPGARTFQAVGGGAWIQTAALTAAMRDARFCRVAAGWGGLRTTRIWALNVIESKSTLAYNDNVYTHFADTAAKDCRTVRTARPDDRLDRRFWGGGPEPSGSDRYRRVRARIGIPTDLLRRCLWCVDGANLLRAAWPGSPDAREAGEERTPHHGISDDG